MAAELWTCNLGRIEYREASAMQERLRAARQADEIPDVLLLLEHPPVYTRGRRSRAGRAADGRAVVPRRRASTSSHTDRGGKLTYHGPGQLVGYAIMRIDDVVAFVRTMERAVVAALADEGDQARARTDEGPDYTGVWVGERKIASIGVHVARGVTTHGFAVNVDNDLQPFEWVVACGLPERAHDLGQRRGGPSCARSIASARRRARYRVRRGARRRTRSGWSSPARARGRAVPSDDATAHTSRARGRIRAGWTC